MSQQRLRILFDAHPLVGKKSGIGYYTSQLVANLAERYPDELEFVGYYHNFLLRKPPVKEPKAANIRYRPIAWLPGQIVNLLRRWHVNLPIELLTLTKADFILYPNYLGQPSLFRTPNTTVVHDLTFVDHPETMSEKNLADLTAFVPAMMRRASFITTVSDFGKQRIAEHFAIDPARIHVTPNPPPAPLQLDKQTATAALRAQGIVKPFILFIGTIEPRKNLASLLDAYTMLPKMTREQYSLVLTGKIDWKYAETKQKIESLQTDGYDIHYLGYVDDTLRAALYSQCTLFAFPPFYEGFGMPILEAFTYDRPCAISDIPVFHEVAGEAAAYFDPSNPGAIATVLNRELHRPTTTSQQRQQQLASFSWDSLCHDFYERIKSAIERAR